MKVFFFFFLKNNFLSVCNKKILNCQKHLIYLMFFWKDFILNFFVVKTFKQIFVTFIMNIHLPCCYLSACAGKQGKKR